MTNVGTVTPCARNHAAARVPMVTMPSNDDTASSISCSIVASAAVNRPKSAILAQQTAAGDLVRAADADVESAAARQACDERGRQTVEQQVHTADDLRSGPNRDRGEGREPGEGRAAQGDQPARRVNHVHAVESGHGQPW